MNTWGDKYRFTSFGESHGAAIGGVIDGFPAGFSIDMQQLQSDLDRRSGRLSDYKATSQRAKHEADQIEWLSGIFEGKTLGTPIAFCIRNTDAHSADYEALKDVLRPSHADFTYQAKYGIRDYRGGGRASARILAAHVVAGNLAKQLLAQRGISITAQVAQIGNLTDTNEINALLTQLQTEGNSIGGIVCCTVSGLPAGVGEPIFDKLSARLAQAMLSINGAKGFDYGSGFQGVGLTGKELSGQDGGIVGGISNGQNVDFRVVFKPTPSIGLAGRYDVCFVPRVPVIVEAMAALTIINLL